MVDFLYVSRQAMIDNFQISLRAIRTLMGLSAAELADYIGVTRQTINNIETNKSKMSPTQYIAVAAVVDNYILTNGEMYNAIATIIDGNGKKRSEYYETSFSNLSLLKRWFACFNDSTEISNSFVTSADNEEYHVFLKRLVTRYKIFVDADVFEVSKANEFVVQLADYLVKENAKLILPIRTIEQIQERLQDASSLENAVKALKLINLLQQKNVVQLRGEDSDSNNHDTILSVFAKFRSLYRLCLITQSESFAHEVKRLNENSENQGFDILVGYVSCDGKFVIYTQNDESTDKHINEIANNSLINSDVQIDEYLADIGKKDDNIGTKLILTGWEQL